MSLRTWIPIILTLAALGCQSQPNSGGTQAGRSASGQSPRNAGSTAGTDAKPVAFLHGEAVVWSDLQPSMIESAGGETLAEMVLERGIDRGLAAKGIKLNDNDLAAERTMLLRALDPDADTATRLLNELRARRGLGDRRYALLLRRNAGLRALVRDQVQVTDAELKAQHQMEYGDGFEARLIVCDTLQEASAVVRRVHGGESFIDIASRESKDESRYQGGLLPVINPADASFPDAIRAAVVRLRPGEVSDPVAMDRGFAVLRLERKIAGRGRGFDDVKSELADKVRLRVERFLMEQTARTIINDAEVVVLDAALQKSWSQQKERLTREPR